MVLNKDQFVKLVIWLVKPAMATKSTIVYHVTNQNSEPSSAINVNVLRDMMRWIRNVCRRWLIRIWFPNPQLNHCVHNKTVNNVQKIYVNHVCPHISFLIITAENVKTNVPNAQVHQVTNVNNADTSKLVISASFVRMWLACIPSEANVKVNVEMEKFIPLKRNAMTVIKIMMMDATQSVW